MSVYPNNYSYRKKLTFNNNIAETFINHPTPIFVTSTTPLDFSKVSSSTGLDVIFTDADGTTNLSFERVGWVDASNIAEFAVKVPTTTASVGTDIYMYYGNAAATDTSSAFNAFGTTSYGLVFHGDKPNTTWLESSGNGLTLNQTGAGITEVTGVLGKAANIPGSTGNSIQSADNTAVDTANFTIEWLGKSADFGSGRRRVYNQQAGGSYVIAGYNANLLELGSSLDGILATRGTDQSDNNWHHFALVRDTINDRARFYIDGSQVGTEISVTNNSATAIASQIMLFKYTEGDSEQPAGVFDEFLFHKVARTDNWINWSKKLRLDQDRITFGSEETPGGVVFVPKVMFF